MSLPRLRSESSQAKKKGSVTGHFKLPVGIPPMSNKNPLLSASEAVMEVVGAKKIRHLLMRNLDQDKRREK